MLVFGLHPIDLGVLVLYLVGCTWLGARIASGSGGTGLKGYFLGESNIPAWAVMISIVATETSAVTFLSVPGNSATPKGNMTFLQLAMGYILARIVVAVVLLPSYFKGEIYTAYQVLEKRFGGGTQKAASVLFLVTRTLASGLRLYLAAVVLREITHWDLSASIGVIAALTLLYTYLGGIKAVVWIDVVQFGVYLVAALAALTILIREIPGGWEEIWTRGMAAHKFRVVDFGFDGVAPPRSLADAWHAFYGMLGLTYSFWAGVIGGLVLDTATHGADQMMVQRYLTARSQRQAGWALIASGFVILTQFALFLAIGVGLWVLYQDQPPTEVMDKSDRFFPLLHRPLPAHGTARAGDRRRLLGDDEHGVGRPQFFGVVDGQRPVSPPVPQRRRDAPVAGLEGNDGVLGGGPDGRGVARRGVDRQRGQQRPVDRLVRDRAVARPVLARPLDA